MKGKGDYSFPRQERLKGRDEIREVFNRRKAVSCAGAKLLTLKNGLDHNRVAFTFSRKFGCAVERNRARRQGREAYRHLRGELKTGFDLVLLVYPGKDDFASRMQQLTELFRRAGLFEGPRIQEHS
ncbi:ribonuclease P protein component [Leadbettera azotonutricia]|uniref:Ribonuclease P protein component n=1 Tax=Leadbettera azotonutricia (strain ATCC BAA-888 / DSM 13862 / ZAS-9) TaxID=545695 RepID=F5Y9B9_LEAAZ|nr:ribonuclease P protein component [Leadbettera azotonutricia]AEF80300.1 ribonuclease P protein component [Leadbettera azotonutricia ZAS-9]